MAKVIPPYKIVRKAGEVPSPSAPAPVVPPTPRELLAKTNPTISTASPKSIAPDPMRKVLTTQEIRSRLVELMWKHRYDPVKELIDLAQDPDTPLKTRVEIHQTLAEFITPKLKAVDLQVQGEMSVTVNVVKFGNSPDAKLAPNREPIPVIATEAAS